MAYFLAVVARFGRDSMHGDSLDRGDAPDPICSAHPCASPLRGWREKWLLAIFSLKCAKKPAK
jgi:hypothetical protein